MARKSKLLTAKIDDEFEQALVRRCASLGCNKSEYVKTLIQSDIDEWEGTKNQNNTTKKASLTGSEPYDVEDESGCIRRFKSDGTLMFHFVPTEKENGVQIYRDVLSTNSKRAWYRDNKQRWVQRIRIY